MGVNLTLKEREPEGNIYIVGRFQGERIRQSTFTDDKGKAEEKGRQLARELVRQMLLANGGGQSTPTVGSVLTKWRDEKKDSYNGTRSRVLDQRASFLEGVWGTNTPVSHLDQDDVDEAVDAVMDRDDVSSKTTARHYLTDTSTIFSWATTRKDSNGEPLLAENPLEDLRFPSRSESATTPVASQVRYIHTLRASRHISGAHPQYLPAMLTLARYTGRRIGAIRQLLRSDLLLDPRRVYAYFHHRGVPAPEARQVAKCWKHGAIRWRRETDKEDRDTVVPLHPVARRAARYQQRRLDRTGIENPHLFPSAVRKGEPIGSHVPDRYLRKAEAIARERGAPVPDFEGHGWHPYRRLWRGERGPRTSFHPKAVAYVGGWTYEGFDTPAMNRGYLPVPPPVALEVAVASPACRLDVVTDDSALWSYDGWEGLSATGF